MIAPIAFGPINRRFFPGLLCLAGLAISLPASAQVAAPTVAGNGGGVGSATLRNGFPAAAGAVTLPSVPVSTNPVSVTAANPTTAGTGSSTANGGIGTTTSGAFGAAGSGGAGTRAGGGSASSRGGGGSTAGGTSSSGIAGIAAGRSGGHWVVCAPTGASGMEPLFTGTGLSCAPD